MTQIVSSISAFEIYAPSAGHAPTNSSEVSAIASGYQVVSSTATQLYAGSAYLTSVNDAPVSASRAGQAANASMANSAYYDGTGRLISALPDEATVSSIASSYAESAASSKLDTTAFSTVSGTFLTAHQSLPESADWESTYNTVSSNSASWGGGGGGGSTFPAEIKSGTTLKAVVTTGFQDNTATRPTLFISSNPLQAAYPRMMLSENHTNTSQGKSAAFLADAFEFYTGNGTKVWRADTGVISSLNKYALNSSTVSASYWTVQSGVVSGGSTTNQWFLNRNGVSGKSGTSTWQYTTAEYGMLTSVHDTVSTNSASWGQGGVSSATVSSIASSYAESSVSGVIGTVSSHSASWGGGGVVTATGSASATSVNGFWTVTSYLVSSINGSALLPYGFSSVSANSANWNSTRTAVTANSANWNSAYSLISGVTALMDAI